MRTYCASRPYGTLYIGVTNDLLGRVEAHRTGEGAGFTARYGVKLLVHDEPFADIEIAIQREKALKHWVRAWSASGGGGLTGADKMPR